MAIDKKPSIHSTNTEKSFIGTNDLFSKDNAVTHFTNTTTKLEKILITNKSEKILITD